MISVLLPIYLGRQNTARDLERACSSLSILSACYSSPQPLVVNIITPRRELELIEIRLSKVSTDNLRIEFWVDEEFSTDDIPNGWVKQQLLKLTFCASCDSEYILVLDADILCCGLFREENLFIGGKCLNGWEGRELHGWFRASSILLGIDFVSEGYGISVTPEMLSKDVCNQLVQCLRRKFGNTWQKSIWVKNRQGLAWSEYSLYTVFAEYMKLLWKHHAHPDDVFRSPIRLTSPLSRWSANAFFQSNLEKVLKRGTPKGLFIVNQSTSNISPVFAARLAKQASAIQSEIGIERAGT